MKWDAKALRSRPYIADGGWTTTLISRGMAPGQPAELANLTHPQLVVELTREYAAAGAQFVTTNTFAANRLALAQRGCEQDATELSKVGVRLAREGLGEADVLLAGAMGPTGKILAVKEADAGELASAFAEQALALQAAGVGAIVLETFSELAEILLALRAVKDATGLPVIACLSFDSGPQRTQTIMGAEAAACAAALDAAGAEAIGCNCCAGIAYVLPAVVALRAATERPLWVKPNAGLPELVNGRATYPQTPEMFASFVPTLLDAGADVVGGCCGTGPEHIRRVAAMLAARKKTAAQRRKREGSPRRRGGTEGR